MSETIELRPAVKWFAEQMELTLRANDHKGGWKERRMQYLFERLEEEMFELTTCSTNEDAIKEASDIANFAMMIADRARMAIEEQKENRP